MVSLDVEVSSAGDLPLSGRAAIQDMEVSNAAGYDGSQLQSQEADLSVSSAGSVRVSVSKRVDARASSGGTIRYSGNPDKVRESSSSGGHIKASN